MPNGESGVPNVGGYCLVSPESRAIICAVARKHGVLLADVMHGNLTRKVTTARQEAYAEVKRQRNLTLHQVARLFGKDHTTVLYGIRAHQARLAYLESKTSVSRKF